MQIGETGSGMQDYSFQTDGLQKYRPVDRLVDLEHEGVEPTSLRMAPPSPDTNQAQPVSYCADGTLAHWWKIETRADGVLEGTCKWCGGVREFSRELKYGVSEGIW